MNCPKCKMEMEERWHTELTNKMLNKPYIFGRWFYCKPCSHVQHVEKYKIINKTRKGGDLK